MRKAPHSLVSVYALAALLLLGACAGKREPAQDLLHQIQGALLMGAEDAAKYAPEQLQHVQAKLNALQAAFDKNDYSAVLAEGPAVLTETEQMTAASVARKQEAKKALTANWSRLAGSIPDRLLMLTQRVDARSQGSVAVKAASREASALWSKARSAFASGNLEEAVRTAKDVETRIDALSQSLDL